MASDLPAIDDYSQVKAYFSHKEWDELSDYEKLRLKNIKENYEMMLEVGLQVGPPEFMRQRRVRKQQLREDSGSEDEDWTPAGPKKKKQTGSFRTPFKPPSRPTKTFTRAKKETTEKPHTVTLGMVSSEDVESVEGRGKMVDDLTWDDEEEETSQQSTNKATTSGDSRKQSGDQPTSCDQETQSGDLATGDKAESAESEGLSLPAPSCMKVGGKIGGKAKSTAEMRRVEKSPPRRTSRYPRRAVTKKSYKEEDVPDDDHYIYCEECDDIFEGECSKHPLTIIKDMPVPKGCKDRAKKTLPHGLLVKESSIPEAGLGVHATTFIPKGYRFGPYDGDVVNSEVGYDSGYAWEISVQGRPHHFIDSNSEKTGNWMRYINCARNEGEQNLVAFQYLGEIYYRSFKPIYPGTELLVYYGEQYAKDLGITLQLNRLKVETDSGLYRCEYCELLFSMPIFLARHIKYRHGHCGLLPSADKSKDDILQYIKGLSSNVGSKCNKVVRNEIYGVGKKNKNGLQNQHRNHVSVKSKSNHEIVNNESLGDMTCEPKISQKSDKDRYITSFDKKKVSDMRAKVSSSLDASNHKRTHTGEKPYVCDQCGKAFSQPGDLTRHKRTHTGEKPYVCGQCGMAFSRLGNLTTHKRTHTGEKPYVCGQCGMAFSRLGDLTTHKRTHTGEKPYVCDQCGKAFSQLGHLIGHKRTHTGEKPYVCDQCGMAFSQSCDLTKHKRTHTGEKPYVCNQCGMAFSQLGNLTTHKRTHSGKKPYVCDQCGMAFSQSGVLTRHKRTHTGEKPYVCDQCGKAFSRLGNLTTHKRTHTGEKPYVCDQCGMAFSRSNALTTHKRSHTGEKPYVCDHCEKAWSNNSSLQYHIRTYHITNPQCNTKAIDQKSSFKDESHGNVTSRNMINEHEG